MSAPITAPRPSLSHQVPAGSSPPVLEIEGLHKQYGDRVVLHRFDMAVHSGELVSVLGANGSGKSTALQCVVGLTQPDDGRITIAGEPVNAGRSRDTRAAMVFQRMHLVPRRSVLDNVCAGALGRLGLRRSWSTMAFPQDVREESMACLDRVGLADRAHDRAGRLSGGQQQRVAIARALCQRAAVLLADEPVSALDPSAAEQVMRLLRSLAVDDAMAVATVLHQPDLARRHSDRLVGLLRGRIVWSGTSEEITDVDITTLYAPDGERP